MSHVWIVVASEKDAIIYSASHQKREFELVKELEHIDSHAGHHENNGKHESFADKAEHKEHEIQAFAGELGKELEHGHSKKSYIGLIVVAEPHFYELLNKANSHMQSYVRHHVPKDYFHYSEHKIRSKLESDLPSALRKIFTA